MELYSGIIFIAIISTGSIDHVGRQTEVAHH
jgi:hypothetical protein